jgi:kynurenine formamidase
MTTHAVKLFFFLGMLLASIEASTAQDNKGLWRVYDDALKGAKYIDLTHVIAPNIPVWHGFGPSKFEPAKAGADIDGLAKKGDAFSFAKHGFEATNYNLATDQFGTQLDPPAHWAPEYPSIDELPATYAVRPLAVISIVDKVTSDPGYHLRVADIEAFEAKHGRIPEGSVVFVRSDWSKDWPNPELAKRRPFPGVSLDALKYLHNERRILFHGHEPLDTDTTPTLEGEHWLMHNGYAQAEGVANLDRVPATGCLVTIGFPRFKGGTGGYARYVAICPPDTPAGVTIGAADAPLPKSVRPLRWDAAAGTRVR